MLILIPCKFYYSPYSCSQIFIHNFLILQSDLFGKPKSFLRDFEFPKSLTCYRPSDLPSIGGCWECSASKSVGSILSSESCIGSFFRPRYILFSFPTWSSSGETSSIPCLDLWISAIGSSRPRCCRRSSGWGVSAFSRGIWARQWPESLVGLPPCTLVFYPFSWWFKWV